MRFALFAFLSWLPALGCGGSLSETPPPLEPGDAVRLEVEQLGVLRATVAGR